jgi:hypothetical protein
VGPSINRIPSMNVPLTDSQGRIHPVWYEFLRSFIASSVEDTDGGGAVLMDNIIAGAGLTKTEADGNLTLNAGAGNGITINANDINVDIANQSGVQAVPDDMILIADASDNNSIRKTTLRDVAALAGSTPGGDDTEIQYNNEGFFEGDPGFTTDGTGNISINGQLDVDNINLNGNSITTTDTNGDLNLNPDGTGRINALKHIELDSNIYIFGVGVDPVEGPLIQANASTITLAQKFSAPQVQLSSSASNNGSFLMQLRDSGSIRFASDDSGVIFTAGSGQLPLRRTVNTGLTASTTQTQGQAALTTDINEVATVANADDVVTLPAALPGRYCLVINNGANQLQVYPASGDDLGAGVNSSTTIATSSNKLFVAYDTTNWRAV